VAAEAAAILTMLDSQGEVVAAEAAIKVVAAAELVV
jgi:hypothetical protein